MNIKELKRWLVNLELSDDYKIVILDSPPWSTYTVKKIDREQKYVLFSPQIDEFDKPEEWKNALEKPLKEISLEELPKIIESSRMLESRLESMMRLFVASIGGASAAHACIESMQCILREVRQGRIVHTGYNKESKQ